ncbi:unnamed protein product, partial [Mesorhabditis belari]|uniref:Uncharacterized protein n=1 Tax=Mesorhabditis belari TaxID=2138241 RepID=A0AAF3EX86_9BILA
MEKLVCYPYLKELIFGCVQFEPIKRIKALHALADVTMHKKLLYERIQEKLAFMPKKDEKETLLKLPQPPKFQEDEIRTDHFDWDQEDLGLADYLSQLVTRECDVERKMMKKKLIDRESKADLSLFTIVQFWLTISLYSKYFHIDFGELYPCKRRYRKHGQKQTEKRTPVKWWDRLPYYTPHEAATSSEMIKCFVSPQVYKAISTSATPEDILSKCGDVLHRLFAPALKTMKEKLRGWSSESQGQDLPAKGYIFEIAFPPQYFCEHRPRHDPHKIMHPSWRVPRLSITCHSCCDEHFPEYVELYFELVDLFFKIRDLDDLSQFVRAVTQITYLRKLCEMAPTSKTFLFKKVQKKENRAWF